MKVYVVIYNLSVGGIFTFAKTLVQQLRNKYQVDASIYVYIPESVALNPNLIQKSGVPIHTAYSNKFTMRLINIFHHTINRLLPKIDIRSKALNYFLRVNIKRHKIDLLHSNYQHCDSACLKIAEKMNKKVVITDHGSYRMHPLPQQRIDLMREIAQHANALISLTDNTEENLLRYKIALSTKIIFKKIFNGIDLSQSPNQDIRVEGVEPDDFVFGMLARGTKEKGWEIAIEAFILLQSQNSSKKIKLLLTGEGQYLKQLSKTYERYSDIIFTGPTEKPLNVIQHYDVALFPSYLDVESMPFSIIEYLQCGKPVLASNIGAIRNMLKAGHLLAGEVLDRNHLNSSNLASFMSTYLHNKKIVTEKSVLTLKAVAKFDIKKNAKQYLEVYRQVC